MNGCFEIVQDYINETNYMHGFDIKPTYVWLKKNNNRMHITQAKNDSSCTFSR